jgi:hypothetical protein
MKKFKVSEKVFNEIKEHEKTLLLITGVSRAQIIYYKDLEFVTVYGRKTKYYITNVTVIVYNPTDKYAKRFVLEYRLDYLRKKWIDLKGQLEGFGYKKKDFVDKK